MIARDADGDAIFDTEQEFSATLAGLNYPNSATVLSLVNTNAALGTGQFAGLRPFGGDFTGLIPCFTPDTDPDSNAQIQIRNGSAASCWTNVYRGVATQPGVPNGRNIANVGGRGELPMRPAPDTGSVEAFEVARAK